MRFRSSNLRGDTKDSCTLMLSFFLLTNWSMNIKGPFIWMVLVQLVPKSFKESVCCVCLSWRRLSILGTALGGSKEQTHYPHFLWFFCFFLHIFIFHCLFWVLVDPWCSTNIFFGWTGNCTTLQPSLPGKPCIDMTAKGWDKGCLDKLWGVLMLWSWWLATFQLILNILYWFERPKFGLKGSKQSQPNGSKIFRLNFPRVLYDAYKLRTSQSAHRQCRGQRCLEVEVPFEAEKVSWAVSVASMSLDFWDAHFVTVSFLFVLDISSRVDVFLVKAASWGRQGYSMLMIQMIQMIQMHIYQKFFCVCTLQHRKTRLWMCPFLRL